MNESEKLKSINEGGYLNVEFSKPDGAFIKHKIEDIEKSLCRIKNHNYLFCGLKCDLFDENNFSQHLLTFCCLGNHSH